MTDYSQFVDKIVKIPQVVDAITQITDPTILDLVTPDWSDRLVNNVQYKEYTANSKQLFRAPTKSKNEVYEFQKVQNPDKHFKVRVAAKCLVPIPYKEEVVKEEKAFSLLLQDSTALKMVVEAMTKDLAPEHRFDDITKVNLDFCNYLSCNDCNEVSQQFRAQHHEIPTKNQTCIRNIQVYDGKEVMNRFGTQMKTMFNGPSFVGIADLELTGRYYYNNKNEELGKTVRVTGKLLNLIAFNEDRLKPMKKVYVGQLLPVQNEGIVDNTLDDMFSVTPSTSGQKRPHEDEECEKDFMCGIPAQYSEYKKCNLEDVCCDDVIEDSETFP